MPRLPRRRVVLKELSEKKNIINTVPATEEEPRARIGITHSLLYGQRVLRGASQIHLMFLSVRFSPRICDLAERRAEARAADSSPRAALLRGRLRSSPVWGRENHERRCRLWTHVPAVPGRGGAAAGQGRPSGRTRPGCPVAWGRQAPAGGLCFEKGAAPGSRSCSPKGAGWGWVTQGSLEKGPRRALRL